jgi:photosystem II stability/assembly factor-like uncharacterized protein
MLCVTSLIAQDWIFTGPFGATISSITVVTHDILLASNYSETFRSANGGKSWSRVELSGAFSRTSGIHFYPGKPEWLLHNVPLLGTLSASSDLGQTWEDITPDNGELYALEFSPHNSNVVFAVGWFYGSAWSSGQGAFFKSIDAGRTWIHNPMPSFASDAQALIPDPKSAGVFYLLVSDAGSGRVYKSIDAGRNWFPQHPGTEYLETLVMDPHDPQTLFAGGWAGVVKTTDGGAHWNSTQCNCVAKSISLNPSNSQIVFAVGEDRLGKGLSQSAGSVDGGKHWFPLALPSAGSYFAVAVDPFQPQRVWIGSDSLGMYLSTDGGRHFSRSNNNLDGFSVSFLRRAPSDQNRIFGVGGYYGSVLFETTDAGRHWIVKSQPLRETYDLRINPKNPDLIAAAGWGPGMAISNDGGKTWSPRNRFLQASSVRWDPASPDNLYLLPSESCKIAHSTDLGRTWRFLCAGFGTERARSLTFAPNRSAEIFVGTDGGKILHSTNSGESWKVFYDFSSSRAYVEQILINQTNPNTMYAILHEEQDYCDCYFLFSSDDGGVHWKQNPTSGIRKLIPDTANPSGLYALTDGAVLYTGNGGDSWTELPWDLAIGDLLITPAHFYAVTERGVYVR